MPSAICHSLSAAYRPHNVNPRSISQPAVERGLFVVNENDRLRFAVCQFGGERGVLFPQCAQSIRHDRAIAERKGHFALSHRAPERFAEMNGDVHRAAPERTGGWYVCGKRNSMSLSLTETCPASMRSRSTRPMR